MQKEFVSKAKDVSMGGQETCQDQRKLAGFWLGHKERRKYCQLRQKDFFWNGLGKELCSVLDLVRQGRLLDIKAER